MNAIVSIIKIEDDFGRKMLKASLSFIHPMVILRDDEEYLNIKLFDCPNEEQLNNKLGHLAEASSVDFSYRYAFVK
jgi:hypothetical protein